MATPIITAGTTRIEPTLRIAPGESLNLEVLEVTTGQITPRSTAKDLLAIDNRLANPLTGPIAIDGARPGDTLAVTVLGFQPSGWGWTGIIPGFGLLPSTSPSRCCTIGTTTG